MISFNSLKNKMHLFYFVHRYYVYFDEINYLRPAVTAFLVIQVHGDAGSGDLAEGRVSS